MAGAHHAAGLAHRFTARQRRVRLRAPHSRVRVLGQAGTRQLSLRGRFRPQPRPGASDPAHRLPAAASRPTRRCSPSTWRCLPRSTRRLSLSTGATTAGAPSGAPLAAWPATTGTRPSRATPAIPTSTASGSGPPVCASATPTASNTLSEPSRQRRRTLGQQPGPQLYRPPRRPQGPHAQPALLPGGEPGLQALADRPCRSTSWTSTSSASRRWPRTGTTARATGAPTPPGSSASAWTVPITSSPTGRTWASTATAKAWPSSAASRFAIRKAATSPPRRTSTASTPARPCWRRWMSLTSARSTSSPPT